MYPLPWETFHFVTAHLVLRGLPKIRDGADFPQLPRRVYDSVENLVQIVKYQLSTADLPKPASFLGIRTGDSEVLTGIAGPPA